MTIPLASQHLSTILIHRIALLTTLFSALLSYNTCYIIPLSTGLGLLGGLFQSTILSQSMEIFLLILGSIILLLVPEENKINNNVVLKDYPLIILFSVLGMVTLISCSDLIVMFLSIELQSFALYIIATMNRNSESAVAAGLKYFLLGGLSSCFILLGSTLIYSYSGLTNFESLNILQSISSQSIEGVSNNYFVIGAIILTSGLLFKIAAAPFHSWSPDVINGVPTIVSTWLAIMPKLSILVFLIINNFIISSDIIMISAILSLIIGTISGLTQFRIKRLLAYSSISHIGFIIYSLSNNLMNGLESSIFYLIQYSISSVNVFLILILFGYIINKNDIIDNYSPIQYIHQLRGLFYRNPSLSISFALSLFSLAGIPPLIGFFGKYFVINTALYNGNYLFSIVIVITSVISAVYYLKIIKTLFLSNSTDNTTSISESNNLSPILAHLVAILTLFIIFFVTYPTFILNSINLIAHTIYYY
jgi:NADH-ubiquinone oxidoreductase chain 2